jgi:cytochrome c553
MRIINRRALSLAASVAVVFGVGAVRAEEGKPGAISAQALQAKVTFCKTCHGKSAQGYYGVVPVPRLAGQPADYIAYQLTALKDRRRVDPFMSEVAKGLTPDMIKALSTQFKDLEPPPASVGSQALMAEGKRIFEEGSPGAEVPPCSACHGDDAKGSGEFPRLAGQLPEYTLRELQEWDSVRGLDPTKADDNAAIMSPITHKLTKEQKAAVAAYVSSLK